MKGRVSQSLRETSTIVIPSDPNALAERLELLLASKAAGNTGVRNELVSICDELLRQKIMNKKQYKKFNDKYIKRKCWPYKIEDLENSSWLVGAEFSVPC